VRHHDLRNDEDHLRADLHDHDEGHLLDQEGHHDEGRFLDQEGHHGVVDENHRYHDAGRRLGHRVWAEGRHGDHLVDDCDHHRGAGRDLHVLHIDSSSCCWCSCLKPRQASSEDQ
jgi:hypothetical protein